MTKVYFVRHAQSDWRCGNCRELFAKRWADFDGTACLGRTEHIHIEKIFKQKRP